AVLVWRSDGTTASGKPKPVAPFLVPVTFYYQKRFFDAGLYKATPRPMAIEPETVYEAQRTGEPVGLFTVNEAVRTDGTWMANGRYRDTTIPEAPKKKSYDAGKDTDEGPPKLRYPKSGDAKPGAEQKPAADSDSPTTPSASPSSDSGSSASSRSGDDSGPPRLKRADSTAAKGDGAAASRPSPKESEKRAMAAAAPSAKGAGEFLVAVSDAKTPLPRSFGFSWSPEEQQRLTREVRAMAAEEINRYAAQRYGYKPQPATPTTPARGARSASAPAAATGTDGLDEFSVRAFDLDTDNYPELIVSASRKLPIAIAAGVPAAIQSFYVVLAVRVELNPNGTDKFTRMLTYNTDDRHLDQFPRMELLDAVDADGGGVGDVLFRTTGPRWN